MGQAGLRGYRYLTCQGLPGTTSLYEAGWVSHREFATTCLNLKASIRRLPYRRKEEETWLEPSQPRRLNLKGHPSPAATVSPPPHGLAATRTNRSKGGLSGISAFCCLYNFHVAITRSISKVASFLEQAPTINVQVTSKKCRLGSFFEGFSGSFEAVFHTNVRRNSGTDQGYCCGALR